MVEDKIKEVLQEIKSFQIESKSDLENFRIKFLGSKNIIKDLFLLMKEVPNEEKKTFGKKLNDLKSLANSRFEEMASNSSENKEVQEFNDLTRPADGKVLGSQHPLKIVENKIIDIFSKIGFSVSYGPEIEDDFHNFSALNFPPEHPARDMQDTFFIEKGSNDIALRTHTSSVQVRVMETSSPPIRTLSPGRVYRNEAISARAHCFFHQIGRAHV